MKQSKKVALFIVAILILMALTVVFYFGQRDGTWFGLKSENITPSGVVNVIEMDSLRERSIATSDEHIYVLINKRLYIYDATGEEVASFAISFDEPKIKEFSWGVVVYETQRGEMWFFHQKEKTSEKILNRKVNTLIGYQNHVMAITGVRDGYLGGITIMDKKAEILSITHYSDRYPVSACFIDEETHYVISSVDFVQTDRIFYDLYSLYGTSPFSGYQTQEYAPLVYHIDENGFIGVGSDVVQIYNNQGKLIDTQQKEAITMSVHNQMNTLYLIAREQSSHSLWSFIEGGTKTLEHRLSITPEGMSSLYGWVAVWGRNQIQVFDQKLNKVLSLDDYYDLRNIHWVAPSLLVIETGQDLVLYNLE